MQFTAKEMSKALSRPPVGPRKNIWEMVLSLPHMLGGLAMLCVAGLTDVTFRDYKMNERYMARSHSA